MLKFTLPEIKRKFKGGRKAWIACDIHNLAINGVAIIGDDHFEAAYDTSNSSIQRDLKDLEKEGLIKREVKKDPFTKQVVERKIHCLFKIVKEEKPQQVKKRQPKVKCPANLPGAIMKAFEDRFNRKPRKEMERLLKAYGEERLYNAVLATDHATSEIVNPEAYIKKCIKNAVVKAKSFVEKVKQAVKRKETCHAYLRYDDLRGTKYWNMDVEDFESLPNKYQILEEARKPQRMSDENLKKIEEMKRKQTEILNHNPVEIPIVTVIDNPESTEFSTEDLAKIEKMKALNSRILGISYV